MPSQTKQMKPKKLQPAVEAQLGDFVRERITGFEGVVTSISQFRSSADRCRVMSRKLKDGKPLGEEHFDRVLLEVIKPGVIPVIPPTDAEPKFKYDDVIRTINGLEGIVTGVGVFITGCRSVRIEPTAKDRDGRPLSDEAVSEGDCVLVTRSAVAPKADGPKKPGGPWKMVDSGAKDF